MTDRVLIVGASVAGLGAANELRRCGYEGGIVLIDAEPHLPYDKPPLSKGVLTGEVADDGTCFHSAEEFAKLRIELRLGQRVVAVNAAAKSVTLEGGDVLAGDAVVLAPGARARQFPAAASCEGVITVRGLDDALHLKEQLPRARSVAIVGGGFIGAEVASSARQLGIAVTVFEMDEMPFMRILGREVAARVAALHTAAGVTVRTGVRVSRIERAGQGHPNAAAEGVYRLTLQDGSVAHADLVVAGLGAIANVEFLAGSGVEVADGIVCDETGRTSKAGIHAAGDAANWPNPHGFPRHRDEHWTSAREQGRIVAQDIVGQRSAAWREYVPYFWSDMHGKRVQVLGSPQHADAVAFVFEDAAKGSFLAEYTRGGDVVGVAGCNAAVRLMKYRARLSRPVAEAAA